MNSASAGETTMTMPFRGQRGYLQGADILKGLLAFIGNPCLGFSFSVHTMLSVGGLKVLELPTTAELGAYPVRLLLADGRIIAAYPIEESTEVERLPDHEEDIWEKSRMDTDSNTIQGFSPLDPLAMDVSLKKQMMTYRLGPNFGKWTFCKLITDHALPLTAERISVRYLQGTRNIHISTILFDDVEHGKMTFMASQ